MSDRYWIGFDLGGTKMLAAVLDDEMKVVGKERKKTRGYLGSKVGLERIIKCINGALDDADINPELVAGIGIGCPGPVNPDKGILIQAPNLGWTEVPIAETLKKQFKADVIVGNDVDLGVYGEFRFGAAKNADSLLGVFPGTGIGGGFVYRGELFQGRHISCMEIGHIPTLPEGPIASAGLPGSLEAMCSRLAMSALIAQAAYRGQAPTITEGAGTDLSDIRSGLLAEAVKNGDEMVIEILNRGNRQLGRSIAGFVHMLAPEKIVLGGGLVEAMPKFFLKSVKDGINEWILPAYKDSFELMIAELGDDAGILGAAAWAKHRLLN